METGQKYDTNYSFSFVMNKSLGRTDIPFGRIIIAEKIGPFFFSLVMAGINFFSLTLFHTTSPSITILSFPVSGSSTRNIAITIIVITYAKKPFKNVCFFIFSLCIGWAWLQLFASFDGPSGKKKKQLGFGFKSNVSNQLHMNYATWNENKKQQTNKSA